MFQIISPRLRHLAHILCDPGIVEIVVKEGPARVQELIDLGTQFDKDPEGDYKLGMEGGHSEFRIFHFFACYIFVMQYAKLGMPTFHPQFIITFGIFIKLGTKIN